jgi:protein SCO1/2
MTITAINPIRRVLTLCVCAVLCMVAAAGLGQAQDKDLTKSIDFQQNLGGQLPMDASLVDETYKPVTLGDMFHHGRPVMIVPVSFKCQSACAVVIDSVIKNLAAMTRTPKFYLGQNHHTLVGKDVDVVMLSIDPRETPADAAAKKALILDAYKQPGAEQGWHLLTGKLEDVRKITDAIGMKFFYDASDGVLRNPTGVVVATQNGTISSYLLGAEYTGSVLSADFQKAAANEIGGKTDKIMFVCFAPDPAAAKNRKLIEGIVSGVSFLTFLGLAGFIVSMCLKERRSTPPQDGALRPAKN